MLCYNCMNNKGDHTICPYCHVDTVPQPLAHHLAPGTVVGSRYTIGKALGEGGFGITYIGSDNKLDMPVAIKEFYFHGYSQRNTGTSQVFPIMTGNNAAMYENGKKRFLAEAKNIARFRSEQGIVNVTDFFEDNNTAYIVMEYLEGIDLRHYLEQHGVMSVDEAIGLLKPVMQSLERIHRAGLIHRDISPDNIMMLENGTVKLMDFGAARDYIEDNRSLSVMLKPGYAPEEQYRRRGEQGPWTDVYGICATLYRCITGKTPIEAIERSYEDDLKKPSELGAAISPAIETVIMHGMAVRKPDRIQNMGELIRELDQAKANPEGSAIGGTVLLDAQPTFDTFKGNTYNDRTVLASDMTQPTTEQPTFLGSAAPPPPPVEYTIPADNPDSETPAASTPAQPKPAVTKRSTAFITAALPIFAVMVFILRYLDLTLAYSSAVIYVPAILTGAIAMGTVSYFVSKKAVNGVMTFNTIVVALVVISIALTAGRVIINDRFDQQMLWAGDVTFLFVFAAVIGIALAEVGKFSRGKQISKKRRIVITISYVLFFLLAFLFFASYCSLHDYSVIYRSLAHAPYTTGLTQAMLILGGALLLGTGTCIVAMKLPKMMGSIYALIIILMCVLIILGLNLYHVLHIFQNVSTSVRSCFAVTVLTSAVFGGLILSRILKKND